MKEMQVHEQMRQHGVRLPRVSSAKALEIVERKKAMLDAHLAGTMTEREDWEIRRNDVVMIDGKTGRMDVAFYCKYVGTTHWICFGKVNVIPAYPLQRCSCKIPHSCK
jgi:hypothetical protein